MNEVRLTDGGGSEDGAGRGVDGHTPTTPSAGSNVSFVDQMMLAVLLTLGGVTVVRYVSLLAENLTTTFLAPLLPIGLR